MTERNNDSEINLDDIGCQKCGDTFRIKYDEVREFLLSRADISYLNHFPFRKEARKFFKDRNTYVFAILSLHCPYCREVEFSKRQHEPVYSKGDLTDKEYLTAIERELRSIGGFEIKKYI